MARKMAPHDGNSAAAHVAHAVSEVIAIYPITPSSPMGEISDEKSARSEKNIWGTVPLVAELQSEGGAAGAVHGALTTGALTTTFTASQGLLLMIPNMYKIAGELTPTVMHVTARSLAAQGLSIFGDHGDVMAVRQTGFSMLASNNVQECMDMAIISHAATLETRLPFVHFFDGFRTSHEIQKIEELEFDDLKAMIDMDAVHAHRNRGLSPDRPVIRGTAQNPDVYFTGRETVNKYYNVAPAKIQAVMDRFAKITGRQYHLFDYYGAPDAENVIIAMGSGCEVIGETVDALNAAGKKVGLLIVRLFRPFDASVFVDALPATTKKIAVLDRTKEPGSLGEPLYEDIRSAIGEEMEKGHKRFSGYPKIVGGRYGLGSAEFTPSHVKAVFDMLDAAPRKNFTVGIIDDVTGTSLECDPSYSIGDDKVYQAMFYGLGSDGTVGANKNSIKIISDETENYTQGYFVYDSKKAGTVTVSHLRFGMEPIRKPYLVSKADFLACHNPTFLEKYDLLKNVKVGGTFLLTTSYGPDTVWATIPGRVQKQIIDKKLKFFVIDAISIAEALGLGGRINTIMQAAFFKISGVIELAKAIDSMKYAIKKTYGKKGDDIVTMNNAAIDKGVTESLQVTVPAATSNPIAAIVPIAGNAPDFVKNVTSKFIMLEGETVKVSEMPDDGTWPVGTTQYEKRNIAVNIPAWNEATCIQCGRCSLICPHAAIRPKAYDAALLEKAPKGFKSCEAKGKEFAGKKYTLQVAPEDCTGCASCVENCPAKDKGAIVMQPQEALRVQERDNWNFFNDVLPEMDASTLDLSSVKGSQFVKPLFEFSGACAGCGETGYVKLATQLFGDRMIIANATGCSSIYGGNLPTTPYTTRKDGHGPAWSNSLFEDNAEFAYGMRMTVDKFSALAIERVQQIIEKRCTSEGALVLLAEILVADQATQAGVEAQRARVAKLKEALKGDSCFECKDLLSLSDYLVKKSVWAFGGDGWAYDIGYGGLDHVLASGKNVNVMVLDTEVYSNTGGQASKSTPMGAVAKFAAGGKPVMKKDLGMIAMSYGYVYVAKISLGANPNQAVKALMEAEAHDGPSLILAYSHCVAHGLKDMNIGLAAQKLAVESGHWPLYRYNPALNGSGKNPFMLDSKEPTLALKDYVLQENRYKILAKSNPTVSAELIAHSQAVVTERFAQLKKLSEAV